jgi:molybdate/tungstate transport system substrate-binding protein
MRSSRLPRRLAGVTVALLGLAAPALAAQDSVSGPLLVYDAGSLAPSLAELLALFVRRHPGVVPVQHSSGSVEAVRRSREPADVPDVLGVADYALIPAFLVPRHATWYATIARNSMVLAYGRRSRFAGEITARNWADVLLQPGVRTRRADPSLDPGAYRVLLLYRLAERLYRRPGLAARLEAAAPIWTPQPGRDVYAQLEAGEFDFIWTYRSQVTSRGLSFVALPHELDLGDPALARWYAGSSVRIARELGGTDSLEIRGEPILYGLTVPASAPHPLAALAFAQLVLSDTGRAVLRRHGFVVPDRPAAGGPGPLPAAIARLVDWAASDSRAR